MKPAIQTPPLPSFAADFLNQLGPERGQALLDALPDVRFFIKDNQGVYIHASRTMYLAHGFSDRSEIIGHSDHEFSPAYLADHYTRDDRQVLNGAEIWGRIELVTKHRGYPDWYVTSKVPLRSIDGRIIGLAGVSRDLRQAAKAASPFTKLAPAIDYIRDQFGSQVELSQLARLSNLSSRSFQRHFKDAFRMTPMEYLRHFRVGKASQLLMETDDTISTIAQITGFCDHSHFVREFTRLTGTSPGAYRKRYRPV